MTVLVTGGTGFIGRYVVDHLIESGTPVVSYNRDYTEHDSPLVTPVQGELFDMPAVVRVIGEHRVQAVIHTAAMSHPGISIDLPITTFAANVDGTLKLLEAVRLTAVRRVVNFSSECVYGHQPTEAVITESVAPLPNTPYAVTKVTTEHLGRVYSDLYGLDVVSLRVSEVYGPGLKMPEILKDMLRAAIDGTEFSMPEGADHRFHFVHARDVARAAVLAARAATLKQPVYNISGGQQVTVAELAGLLSGRFPSARFSIGPGYWTGWDRQGPWDISAAARDLGYTPAWSLEHGIDDYTQWLSQHPY